MPKYQHSYTKLDLDGHCPGALKLRYIDKAAQRRSAIRDRGSLVHRINKQYVDELVSHMRSQDVPLMLDLARAAFAAQTDLPNDYMDEVLEIAETTAANFELDWMHFAGAERFFPKGKPAWKLGGEFMYRGLIDLLIVDGPFAHVIDWKTPHAITPQWQVDRSLQLKGYALAVSKENPEVEIVRVGYFHCRHGIEVWTEIDREEVEKIEADILALIKQLEARTEFPFVETSYCSLCDYANPEQCPRMRKAMEPGQIRIVSDEDARSYAGERTVLERRLTDINDALKVWTTPNGPVTAGDMVYGYQDVRYRTRDPKKTAKLLADGGIDPFEAGLKFDNKTLDKVMLQKGSPALVQAIEGVTETRAFSKFVAKRAGEEAAG